MGRTDRTDARHLRGLLAAEQLPESWSAGVGVQRGR
jgi:hypothetical protein